MADHVYKYMSPDEQDDIKVSFLASQEKDLFNHEINLARFNEMLKKLPEGPYKARVQQLRDDTVSRITEVTAIIDATELSLPSSERVDASKTRLSINVIKEG